MHIYIHQDKNRPRPIQNKIVRTLSLFCALSSNEIELDGLTGLAAVSMFRSIAIKQLTQQQSIFQSCHGALSTPT